VRQVLVVPGEVVPALRQELGFPVGGRLAELTVRPGDVVTQGQVLARLETEPLEQAVALAQIDLEVKQATLEKLRAGAPDMELAMARAELAAAQAKLEKLKAGPSAAELAAARADLAAAQARLDKLKAGPDPAAVERARFALETARNSLWSAQVYRDAICGRKGPKWQCDQAEAAVGNADVAVRQAQAELERLLAGPSPDEVKAAELDVQKAQARLAQLTAGPSPDELKMAELEVLRAQARLAPDRIPPRSSRPRQPYRRPGLLWRRPRPTWRRQPSSHPSAGRCWTSRPGPATGSTLMPPSSNWPT